MVVLTDEDTLITREQLDRGFKEKMKAQERQAIRALVTAKELVVDMLNREHTVTKLPGESIMNNYTY